MKSRCGRRNLPRTDDDPALTAPQPVHNTVEVALTDSGLLSPTFIDSTRFFSFKVMSDRILANSGWAMTVEPWVSVDEVARHLGVAKDSVYRWIETKQLPAHRIGRLWKFRLSEIDEWVEAGADSADATNEPGPRKS